MLDCLRDQVSWNGTLLWSIFSLFLRFFRGFLLDLFHSFFLLLAALVLLSQLLLDCFVLLVAEVGGFGLHGHFLLLQLISLLPELLGNLRGLVSLRVLLLGLGEVLRRSRARWRGDMCGRRCSMWLWRSSMGS